MRFEGIGKGNLEAPTRLELATIPLAIGRSFHLSYGAPRFNYSIGISNSVVTNPLPLWKTCACGGSRTRAAIFI